MQFKDRLKMLRKEKKLTQVRLGKMLNYGYTAIANYESGRNNPDLSLCFILIKSAESQPMHNSADFFVSGL